LEQDIGIKVKDFMSKRIKYTDGEIGTVKIVKDFLPHPKELLLKDDSVKVTISLSKESVEFFKSEAAHSHVPYQKMIRVLLDKYTKHYKENKRA
jgi:predicted DNA binding CopG/RHH family protein